MKSKVALLAVAGLALALPGNAADTKKAKPASGATYFSSAKATYKEVAPGVTKADVWGDAEKGAYGAFTRFAPDLKNPLHTHSNDIKIVVIKGAYLYTPEGGKERRVGPGDFLLVPAGTRHTSGGDAKLGALFFEESTGKFDLTPVEKNP